MCTTDQVYQSTQWILHAPPLKVGFPTTRSRRGDTQAQGGGAGRRTRCTCLLLQSNLKKARRSDGALQNFGPSAAVRDLALI